MARPSPLAPLLDQPCAQADFGAIVGVTRPRIGELIREGVLKPGGTLREWGRAFVHNARLNGFGGKPNDKPRVAPGTARPPAISDDPDEIDPNREKALLAREQRRGHEIKNRVSEGKYAEIGLLADVLAEASAAVVAQFDQLEGRLAKECPDLPEDAKRVTLQTLARARNLWITETSELVKRRVAEMAEAEDAE